MRVPQLVRLTAAIAMSLAVASSAFAAGAVVFGPVTYTLTGSTTQTFDATISIDTTSPCAKNATYTLVIQNGDPSGPRRITTGGVTLNGVLLAKNPDFSVTNAQFSYLVQVHPTNTLHVELDKGDFTSGSPYIVVSLVRSSIAPVFGFSTYTTSSPSTTSSFSADPTLSYRLVVFNGDADGNLRASSGTVTVNGTAAVVSPNDLNQNVIAITKPIQLAATNSISVAVKSSGAQLVVGVVPTTSIPPSVAITEPQQDSYTSRPTILVSGTVATGSLPVTSVRVNGVEAELSAGTFSQGAAITPGANTISVVATDCDGQQSTASVRVIRDSQPPVLSNVSPATGTTVSTSQITVRGVVTDNIRVASLTVNGTMITVANDGTFAAPITLNLGQNLIAVSAVDEVGNGATATLTITLDQQPPTLTVDPTPAATNSPTLTVSGDASDDTEAFQVTINGMPAPLTAGHFSADITLTDGVNHVQVVASDSAGNQTTVTRDITYFAVPVVTIQSPADLSIVPATTTVVTGTVSDPTAAVTVNDVQAVVSGTTFTAAGVPLAEGGNVLSAVATNAAGHKGTAVVSVVRDLTPPRLFITTPSAGAVVYDPTTDVAGLVNDIVLGTVNRGQVTVAVNGRAAEVTSRGFFAPAVPLVAGDNLITVTATDIAGNTAQTQATVRYSTNVAAIHVVSGDRQTVNVATQVPAALTVMILSGSGVPVANVPVTFRVRLNDGTLTGGGRTYTTNTDAQGQAATQFTAGSWAGFQAVEATAAGFAGTAVFTTKVLPGPLAKLVEDSGNQQVGATSQPLPAPFVVVAVDSTMNRLSNVPVTFRVFSGGGHFPNGDTQITVVSDPDGRAAATLTLGPNDGISTNIVDATVDTSSDVSGLVFTASAKTPLDPADTTVTGTVLDNQDVGVQGVTVSILGTTLSTQTDAHGYFKITSAPVGAIHLKIDSSTAQRPGTWANLLFMLVTIPGQENTVGRAIYILPINVDRGLQVSGTTGGTLTLAEVPGLSLTVAPGSVTFGDGTKSGTVSMTLVHNDKVPMMPNFGQQPRMVITLQPPSAHFDPPAAISYPNTDGLLPGQIAELYSFDHDLGMFVSVGPGTVTDDGTAIVSNPGVGILKGGWQLAATPPPPPTTTVYKCSECTKLIQKKCQPDPAKQCLPCGGANSGKLCDGGQCVVPSFALIGITTPSGNKSFISTDQVLVTAASKPACLVSKIKWQSSGSAASGSLNPNTGTGATYNPSPAPPAPTAPSGYRSGPLSYTITATLGGLAAQTTITQDELDVIRQQYIDGKKKYFPFRPEFISHGATSPSGLFTFDDIQSNDGANYALFKIWGNIELWRNNFGGDFPQGIERGYSTPKYNATIKNAKPNSQHILGMALDVGNVGQDEWKDLKAAAKLAGGCVEPYIDAPTHVHTDWRVSGCPVGW